MHSTTFSNITITDLLSIINKIHEHYEVDCFLSMGQYKDETTSYVGVNLSKEFIVTKDTTIEEIKTFCFSSSIQTFGYLSYHYGLLLKDISSSPESRFPYGHLKQYSTLIKHDAETNELHLQNDQKEFLTIKNIIEQKQSILKGAKLDLPTLQQNMCKDTYIAKVNDVLQHIKLGDTYQLNLSIKFKAVFDKAPATVPFFLNLAQQHPAPFYTYFSSAPYHIVSSSPERFVKVKDSKLLSQPIKGTKQVQNDKTQALKALTSSSKESAELSMIVDLIRNDMSEFCTPGTVSVKDHKSVFQVDSILQMYSNVTGTLKPEVDVIDLLLGSFPGGSITGCPKKRSMELIDTLEPHSRDIYCGSFFIIDDKKNMDASIAIRTGYFHDNQFSFFAGSGIVIQSNPDEEYLETLSKAEKFLKLMTPNN